MNKEQKINEWSNRYYTNAPLDQEENCEVCNRKGYASDMIYYEDRFFCDEFCKKEYLDFENDMETQTDF